MRYTIYILLFVAFLVSACDSPIDVQAGRKKIDTRRDGKDLFEIEPASNFLGDLLYNREIEIKFNIKNKSNSEIVINKGFFKNQAHFFRFLHSDKIVLSPQGSSGSEKTVSVIIQPTRFGLLSDTLFFDDYFEPFIEYKASIPNFYTSDVDFGIVKLNERKYKTIDVYNFGSDTVFIKGVKSSGGFALFKLENFNASESNPIAVLPNSIAKQLIISFQPKETVEYEAGFEFIIESSGNGLFDNFSSVVGSGTN